MNNEFNADAEAITPADIAAAAREYEEREQHRLVAWTFLPMRRDCIGEEFELILKHSNANARKLIPKANISKMARREKENRIREMAAIFEAAEASETPLADMLPDPIYSERDIRSKRKIKQL